MKRVAALALLCLLSACSRPEQARNVLEGEGYANIQIKGYDFFSCSRGDRFHTKFEATGPTGKHVEGVVCSGILKGATVRITRVSEGGTSSEDAVSSE